MHLIACIPVDISGLPLQNSVPKPGIEHTLIQCFGCGEDCWIGPAQKKAANAGLGLAVCYHCVFAGLPAGFNIVELNPDEKRIPRT